MRADRGAILIHVALAIAMLFALSAFVVDRGVFWVARGEAQTAAEYEQHGHERDDLLVHVLQRA